MSENFPIIGTNDVVSNQMIKFVKSVNPNFNEKIADLFLSIGSKYNVRGDIAFCQAVHETDYFRFTGDVKKEQNNFAGIGAVGGGVRGHSFSTIEVGITAQIQHLYAYATDKDFPVDEQIVDPRFEKVTRGSAPYWDYLSGKWAYPGYDRTKYSSLEEAKKNNGTYGSKILKLYDEIKQVKVDKLNRNFKSYNKQQFTTFIRSLPSIISRKVTHIQIHHTWKPRKSDYRGEKTIEAMWRYHTQTRGWSDIGQHFSVSPDGLVWDGRPLTIDPAGISGHNNGGIMFEIIGNFDKGEETLEGKQLDAVVSAVKVLMKHFKLTEENIVFHREHASKSCPGTGITKEWFINQLKTEEPPEKKVLSAYDPGAEESPYPENTAEWKKEAIDWMYNEGLLTDEMWKGKLNNPLPLWAEAIILKRIMEKLK